MNRSSTSNGVEIRSSGRPRSSRRAEVDEASDSSGDESEDVSRPPRNKRRTHSSSVSPGNVEADIDNEELNEPEVGDSDDDVDEEDGDEVTRGQVQPSTESQYASKCVMFAKFLINKYPTAVQGDPPVIIPSALTRAMLKAFLHWYCRFESSGRYKSVGAVKNAINGIVSIWKLRGKKMPEKLHRFTKQYRSYYRRLHARAVKEGHADSESGSAEITFEGYCLIALRLAQLRGLWSSPLFWTSLWNFVCRGISTGGLSTTVIRWKCDALRSKLLATKNDPTSESVYEKNIYPNLERNEICMILWLAVEIFSKPFREADADDDNDVLPIFKGACPEEVFSKHLRKALSNEVVDGFQPLDEAILGAKRDDIGTHTPRKSTGPEAEKYEEIQCGRAFDIRGGWGLGKVRDRYNSKPGEGADKILGRVLAGLDPNEDSFAALPPRFNPEGMALLTDDFWKANVAGYEHMRPGFKSALPFLLARLVVGYEWLDRTLPKIEHNKPTHPLRIAPIINHIAELKPHVICNVGWVYSAGKLSCPITKMRATGVPSFIVTSIRLKQVEERLQALDTRLTTAISDLGKDIVKLLDEVPAATSKQVWNLICDRLEGSNIRMAPRDIEQIVDSRFLRLEELIRDLRPAINASAVPQITSAVPPAFQFNAETKLFSWGGKHHRAPEDFVFPHGTDVTLKSVWDLWFFGCRQGESEIGPFRFFEDKNDLKNSIDRQYMTRARYILQKLILEGVKAGITRAQMNAASRLESIEFYSKCFESLKELVYANTHTLPKPLDLNGGHSFSYAYNILHTALK